MTKTLKMVLPFLSAILLVARSAPGASNGQENSAFLDAVGRRGPLVVLVGEADEALTALLLRSGSLRVHWFVSDEDSLRGSRQSLRDKGVADKIWIDRLQGAHLPFAENMANRVDARGLALLKTDDSPDGFSTDSLQKGPPAQKDSPFSRKIPKPERLSTF